MGHNPAEKHADTLVPIHPDIAARWSPRMFDPEAVLDAEHLIAVLEAARYAHAAGALVMVCIDEGECGRRGRGDYVRVSPDRRRTASWWCR